MTSSVVGDAIELAEFLEAADEDLGDPALAVCLVLVRWHERTVPRAPEIGAIWDGAEVEVIIPQQQGEPVVIPLRVEDEGPRIEGNTLVAFGARMFTGGAWALEPSLNIPGTLHAFIVLTGVPDPPPWRQRVVLATADLIRELSRRKR